MVKKKKREKKVMKRHTLYFVIELRFNITITVVNKAFENM